MTPEWPLIGENVPSSRGLLGDEDSDELGLQRAEILEQAEDLVVIALVELFEVAEVLFEDHLARVAIEDRQVDVEHEAGGLDEHLPLIDAAVRGRHVVLRLVAGAVVDVEIDDS